MAAGTKKIAKRIKSAFFLKMTRYSCTCLEMGMPIFQEDLNQNSARMICKWSPFKFMQLTIRQTSAAVT